MLQDTENRVYCKSVTGTNEKLFAINFTFPSVLQTYLLQQLKITLVYALQYLHFLVSTYFHYSMI